MKFAWIITGFLLIALGCDDPTPRVVVSTDLPKPTADVPKPSRPTTQELMSAPRSTVTLTPYPMTVSLPKGWEFKITNEGRTIIEGPTPHSSIQFLISPRGTIGADQLQRMFASARRDYESRKGAFKKFEIKENSRVSTFEIQEFFEGATPNYNWSIHFYASQGSKLESYEVSALVIEQAQFETDREFLAQIIDSIAVSPSENLLK